MNRLPALISNGRAAMLVILFGAAVQTGLAASRGVNAYTADSGLGGRVVATINWRPAKTNGPYAGNVYGTVFDREAGDDYCALAQVSLDGFVNNLQRACPNDR